MNPFTQAVQAFLFNEQTIRALDDMDLALAMVICEIAPRDLMFHALCLQYPHQIKLRQIRATACPQGDAKIVLGRSTCLMIDGKILHPGGLLDMKKAKQELKPRIDKLLEKRSLPSNTPISFSSHAVRATKEDLRMLCPELMEMVRVGMSTQIALVAAQHLDDETPNASAARHGARL